MTRAQIDRAVNAEICRQGNLGLWMIAQLDKGRRALRLEQRKRHVSRFNKG